MTPLTTALRTGINYCGIKAVVHSGLPYELIDFTQESGKAGRDGEAVDSVILPEQGWEEELLWRREREKIALGEKEG